MKRLALVSVLAAVAFALVGCPKEEEPKKEPPAAKTEPLKPAEPTPPAKVEPAVPAPVASIQSNLDAAGMKVAETKVLVGHTMPGCKEEYRYRLYLGDPAAKELEFVNVSRFASAADAAACFEEYKAAVMKGGEAAWTRLGPLVSANEQWLYMFSEAMTDAARREKILAEVKKVQ